MKRLIVLFLILSGLVGYGQYTPSQHVPVNKGIGIAQAAPTDARSYYYDGGTFSYRPFNSTAEVLTYLNTSTKRSGNFPIYVTISGVRKMYMFLNGTADGDLKEVVMLQPSDTTRLVNIDSLQVLNDSTIRTRKNGLWTSYTIRGTGGVSQSQLNDTAAALRAAVTGSNLTVRNTGATGNGLAVSINDSTLGVKKLIAGSGVILTSADSSITIAASGGSVGDTVRLNASTAYSADTLYTFGDSYTSGVGASNNLYRYSTLLASHLGLVEKNYGVSGSTLMKRTPVDPYGAVNLIDRLSTIPTKTAKSKYILFAYGLNDIGYNGANYTATNFSTDYRQVLDTVLARGWSAADIILLTPWYIPNEGYVSYASSTGTTQATQARHYLFADTVKALASQYGTKVVDIFRSQTATDTTQLHDADNIHPNNAGHAYIAQYAFTKVGYTVPANQQNLAVNGKSELQSLYLPTQDTIPANYNLRAVGLTTDNKLVAYKIGGIIRNNTSTQSDNGRIWISGKILQGQTADPSHVEKVISTGGIKGGFLRANGSLPGGMTGSAVEIGMISTSGYVGAYNRTSSATLPLLLNGLGGQVVVGGLSTSGSHALYTTGTIGATAPADSDSSATLVTSGWVKRQGYGTGGGGGGGSYIPLTFSGAVSVTQASNLLTFDYGVTGRQFRATGAAGTYSTGAGVELAYTGGIGYLFAIDRSTGLEKPLSLNYQAAQPVLVGTNSVSGTNILQVNGNASATKLRVGSTSSPTYALENATTGATLIGGGTTAQRPAGIDGGVRYNSDTATLEAYHGSAWNAYATRNWVRDNYQSKVTESTYTVTLTNTTNIASSSTNTTYYQRVGDVVHVWGEFTATATATGICEMGFSIPVSSGFTNSFDGAGTGSSDAYSVRIFSDATNDRMTFRWTAPNTSATTHSFHFTYKYKAP